MTYTRQHRAIAVRRANRAVDEMRDQHYAGIVARPSRPLEFGPFSFRCPECGAGLTSKSPRKRCPCGVLAERLKSER